MVRSDTLPGQTKPRRPKDGLRVLTAVSLLVAAACALPMLAVLLAALSGGTDTVSHLISTVLPRYAGTTVVLVLLVSAGTFCVGVGAAWLVTMTRFPAVRFFEIAMVLPLAFPAYVLAYAYTHVLDHPGIVQSTLRQVTGWGPRDYWFPEIRSVGGAAVMLILVLYPYVYLLARAAFLQQSGTTFLAARALGASAWSAFFKISLPLARPAIAAGVLLAVMETIADFGTVAYFGVQTFATGIYTSWFSMADRSAAAQLAFCLLSFALLLAVLERAQRGRAKYHDASRRQQAMEPARLTGGTATVAVILCSIPVLLGAVLPVIVLLNMGLGSEQNLLSPRYVGFVRNSLTLASIAAILTVAAAVSVGFFQRQRPGGLSDHRIDLAAGRGLYGTVSCGSFGRLRGRSSDGADKHGCRSALSGPGPHRHIAAGASADSRAQPSDGRPDRFCGCDEGIARHADHAAVQFRYACGTGVSTGFR